MTQEDPKGEFARKYNLKSLEAMFCAGERLDPTTLVYYQNLLKVPIRDNYWQTELGSPCVATSQLDKTLVKVGSSGLPVAGFDFHVMKLEDEELGDLVIKLPLPPGCLTTMFKNHEKFVDSYLTKYKGYYDLADSGMIDKDGYVFIMGRTDDIINIAGHRLSTGGMEEVIASHPNVAEVAVVAVKDILKGEIPLCFAVLKSGVVVCEADLIKSLQQLIRERIGAFACFKRVVMVKKLPKTRSGKILRRTLKSIGQGDVYKIPATIDDVDVLSQIESSFLAESSKL